MLVKHAAEKWGRQAADTGTPLIWDVLDWWKQPEENARPLAGHIAAVQAQAREIGNPTLIGATQAMADDIGGIYIPHHSRPGLTPAPIRERATTVVYEGTKKYLGSWHRAIESACAEMDLTFVINPPDLREADIVVAFRGEQWDGAICRRWKSGVKYVNAIAVGRPMLTQPSETASEIRTPGCILNMNIRDALVDVLRVCQPLGYRQFIARACLELAPLYTRDEVSDRYRALFRQVTRQAA